VAFASALVGLLRILPGLGKPILAAINGDALASGYSLVCAADVALTAITPGSAASRLPSASGRCRSGPSAAAPASAPRAREPAMTGEVNGDVGVIGEATVARPGTDVTLVSAMRTLSECPAAADTLAGEGVECEVIDLRTLRPLETLTVLRPVEKTNRLLVVEKGPRTGAGPLRCSRPSPQTAWATSTTSVASPPRTIRSPPARRWRTRHPRP
jgi:deoxyxylulose-5-phosphate synthase